MSAASPIPDSIRAEAERWFGLMMAPDCPPERMAAFRQWLQLEAMHRQAYLETERLWERLQDVVERPGVRALPEAAPPAALTPAALAALEFRARAPGRPAPMRRWAAALAACLALAAVGAFWWMQQQLPQPLLLQTAVGESRSVTLEDGSMITLDTDSRIAVAFGPRGRGIELQRGAAFFDVTPEPDRPFVVETPHGRVTVLGTQFQVRQDPDEIRVVLVKGAVHLQAEHSEGVTLRPGQQAHRGAGMDWRVAQADPDSVAWRQGRLVFRSTPLSQAVAEVNRYSSRKLRVGDSSLDAYTVSGVFRTGDPDSFVLVLENSLPIRMEASGPERLLLRSEQ